ncbi:MAG: NUDIX domain-containing protein [Gammaproteobacteria bacterium]|nr:MAG: NUDIX domain-containing protein [Gammaproteobacteria bacterium]
MLREAAAMVLIRDADRHGIEVCMLRRVAKSSFAASAFVFPGGAVDKGDSEANWTDYFIDSGVSLLDKLATTYKIAAIRETFEEAGIMVAGFPDSIEISAEQRALLNQGQASFQDILNANQLKINLKEVLFYDHWITPVGAPIRFDTRFFIAVAQAEQTVLHDNQETDLSRWASPAEFLELYDKKEVKLMPVTHVQLERLSRFKSVEAVLKATHKEPVCEPTLPVLTYDEGGKPFSVKIALREGAVEYPVFLK